MITTPMKMPLPRPMHPVYRFFDYLVTMGNFWTIPRNDQFFLKMFQIYVSIWRIMMFQFAPDAFHIAFIVTDEESCYQAVHDIRDTLVEFLFYHEFS